MTWEEELWLWAHQPDTPWKSIWLGKVDCIINHIWWEIHYLWSLIWLYFTLWFYLWHTWPSGLCVSQDRQREWEAKKARTFDSYPDGHWARTVHQMYIEASTVVKDIPKVKDLFNFFFTLKIISFIFWHHHLITHWLISFSSSKPFHIPL